MKSPSEARRLRSEIPMDSVSRESLVEELVRVNSDVVRVLILEGLPCVVCGEPFWGTLEELARQKGWDDAKIDSLVEKMRGL